MYPPNQQPPFQPRPPYPYIPPPMPPPNPHPVYRYPYAPYTNYQHLPVFYPAITYQFPHSQGTTPASMTYDYPYPNAHTPASTYGTQQYLNMTNSYMPQSVYQPPSTNPITIDAGFSQTAQTAKPDPDRPPPPPPPPLTPPPAPQVRHSSYSSEIPAWQQRIGNPADPLPGIQKSGVMGYSLTCSTSAPWLSSNTFGSPSIPPKPQTAISRAPVANTNITQQALAPKANNQFNNEAKLKKTTVKGEKVDSKTLVDRENQPKAVFTFNVPSAALSTINHTNILGKRKRSENKENISCSAEKAESTATKTAFEIKNSRPPALIVTTKPRAPAMPSNQAFLAVLSPSSVPEQKPTEIAVTNARTQAARILDNSTNIYGTQKSTGKDTIPLRASFPNIQNQPILVIWPCADEAPQMETQPPLINQLKRGALESEDSPASLTNNNSGFRSKDPMEKENRVSAVALGERYLRYATPKEMQEVIRHIEEEQWKARAAATYERPRNPKECFAEFDWHPYQCFICKQTGNIWKEFKNHVEVTHCVIMRDKIGAWECFYPTCNKLFGDRAKGVQHATEEHWRAFCAPPAANEFGRTYVEDGWKISRSGA